MTKTTEEKALAATQGLSANRVAVYDPMVTPAGAAIERGSTLPIVKVFQASKKEVSKYNAEGGNDLEYGDIFVGATGERLVKSGEARDFIVVNRKPRFQLTVWPKIRGDGPPLESYDIDLDIPIGQQVPTEYLKNGGKVASFNGDSTQDFDVRLSWCYGAIFAPQGEIATWDGMEPVLLVFSWTSQGCGIVIESKEESRALQGKSGALWRLTSHEKKNDQGEWMSPQVALSGDAPKEAADAAKKCGTARVRAAKIDMEW